MLRSLRNIKDQQNNQEEITTLFTEKNKIKNRVSSKENSKKLKRLQGNIDRILFVPEIISVVIDDNRHYDNIIKNGLFINNKKFVRLLCGAGNARRDTVIFVAENYEFELKELLNNNRNSTQLVPAKFNAYFALCASATLQVSEPYFCVIPDCVIPKTVEVDYINGDNTVIQKQMEISFNLFDGMGLISPRGAEMWAGDLGLDYIPATFIIRNSFLKGMVCVMDFNKFSDEIGKHLIKDIWGNTVNTRDMDLILTESQFKLWNAYDSCDTYIQACRQNNMTWGISRYAPKEESTFVFSNYQFLQALDLNESQIEKLCQKTIDYFEGVINEDIAYTLLYLLGKNSSKSYDSNIIDKVYDNVTKAILLHNDLLTDPYIKNYIIRSLNKKIKKSYIGNLIMDGNYQIMIHDPYAFMEHAFSLSVKGLLEKNTHYSTYWNERDVDIVVACRPPLTWRSEVNKLNLISGAKQKHWYKHITGGIIYNIHGHDTMLHADSDVDGDIIMTTNNTQIIDGSYGGLPITYELNKISKETIMEEELYKVDKKAFHTKIGFITNCSTTLYSMLPEYKEGSLEYNTLINRLKICRKEQGNQIDKSKGLQVKPFPKHWTTWQKVQVDKEYSSRDLKKIDLDNSIIIDKRPYFMRYLYSGYNKKYKKHLHNYDNYSIAFFGKELDQLLKNPGTKEEHDTISKYYRFSPLLDSKCLMNKVCHYMESQVNLLKEKHRPHITEKNIMLLKDHSIETDPTKLKKLYDLYKKYKNEKRNFAMIYNEDGTAKYKTIEQFNKSVRQEAYNTISSNISELANLAVAICYEAHVADNKSFAWSVFSEGIIQNIMKNKQKNIVAPFLDRNGDIEYLGNMYALKNIEI